VSMSATARSIRCSSSSHRMGSAIISTSLSMTWPDAEPGSVLSSGDS
jgi:hypothetical protein